MHFVRNVNANLSTLEELTLRQRFLEESGNYLPGDLWPGLLDPPAVLEVVCSKEWMLPDVSASSIKVAKQFLKRY